MDVADTS